MYRKLRTITKTTRKTIITIKEDINFDDIDIDMSSEKRQRNRLNSRFEPTIICLPSEPIATILAKYRYSRRREALTSFNQLNNQASKLPYHAAIIIILSC